jgi:hypothetical protein
MKKISLIIICLAVANIVTAQTGQTAQTGEPQQTAQVKKTGYTKPDKPVKADEELSVHEFSASVMGGVSSFGYKVSDGSGSTGFGGGIELGYAFNFNRQFAVLTALGVMIYNRTLDSNSSETYDATDENGDRFKFSYLISGYSEKQTATTLYLPLMARYRMPLSNEKLKYTVAGGFKFGLPLNSKATISRGAVTSTGYYEYEDRLYFGMPEHGFVTDRPVPQSREDIDAGFLTMLSIETGVQLSSGNNKFDLRVFFDYGLNDVHKSKDKHIVEFIQSNPSQFKYNSILNTELIDKVNLFSAGLKLGVRF